jgi:periplasmic divalent cation tolerance protein
MAACIQIHWTSASLEEARKIIAGLLEKKWVACAQIVPQIESHFIWKGELTTAQEVLVILKTRLERFEEVKTFIQENCSYEVPEILQIRCDEGNKAYLEWVFNSTQ